MYNNALSILKERYNVLVNILLIEERIVFDILHARRNTWFMEMSLRKERDKEF